MSFSENNFLSLSLSLSLSYIYIYCQEKNIYLLQNAHVKGFSRLVIGIQEVNLTGKEKERFYQPHVERQVIII
tara:strand:+ start:129 stop:347 length:219 start_codon:yes stop_codon:yes gene_type:complete